MGRHRLPDLPNEAPATAPLGAAAAPCDGYATWLATGEFAPWARQWLSELSGRFQDALPEMVLRGLGGRWHVPSWMSLGAPDPVWLRRYLRESSLAESWLESGFFIDDPPWLERLIEQESARVARSFLVSGNVNDYVFDPVRGYRPAIRAILDRLQRIKDVVLHYRLSQGLRLLAAPCLRERVPEGIRSIAERRLPDPGAVLEGEIRAVIGQINLWLSEKAGEDFPRGVALVFENVHLMLPSGGGDGLERAFLIDCLLHWSISPELFRHSHCLVLTAESLEGVSGELRARGGKIEQIAVPRPDHPGTRLKFLLPLLDAGSEMPETRASELARGLVLGGYSGSHWEQLRQIAHDTSGLTLLGIEDLLQQSAARRDRAVSRDAVMELKRLRLRQESEGLLEVVEARVRLADLGGYPELKDRLREVIAMMRRADDEAIRSVIPMGLLFLGPPGTGKSVMAEAIAGESGICLARLGDFRGMYVGQSERNLSRIFALIESLHPVIVFIDELDQALGQRGGPSGDSGVDNRIFGKLLEFLSDTEHRGRILWVGASNFPDRIDPAMKRPGRFDLILPFLLPDEPSRCEILKVLLERDTGPKRGLRMELSPTDLDAMAARTEGFSGAELRAVVGESLRRALHRRLASGTEVSITREQFEQVLLAYSPPPGQRQQYRVMEDLAIREVSFLDLLPPSYRARRAGSNNG